MQSGVLDLAQTPSPLLSQTTSTRRLQSPSTNRTRLEEDDQLILIRLCVSHQSEYIEGKKGDFWAKMAVLLDRETGKRLRDPASTVKGLVSTRKVNYSFLTLKYSNLTKI